jgi:hypothetical protein
MVNDEGPEFIGSASLTHPTLATFAVRLSATSSSLFGE